MNSMMQRDLRPVFIIFDRYFFTLIAIINDPAEYSIQESREKKTYRIIFYEQNHLLRGLFENEEEE